MAGDAIWGGGGVKTPVGGSRRYLGGGGCGGVKTPVGGSRRYRGGGGVEV